MTRKAKSATVKKDAFVINERFELTEKHSEIVTSILDRNNKLIFIDGPAGTAKTYCAVLAAIKLIQRKSFGEILYLRSIAESSPQKLGSLPGEVHEKIGPFGTPFIEKLEEMITPATINKLGTEGILDVQPLNYLRGTTFNNKIVLLDEAQNAELDQLIIVLTRLGEHGKLIVIGDSLQVDIKDKKSYGKLVDKFNSEDCRENGIVSFRLGEEDIKRSKILRFIVRKLEELKHNN